MLGEEPTSVRKAFTLSVSESVRTNSEAKATIESLLNSPQREFQIPPLYAK
jgi:hypothetical protein